MLRRAASYERLYDGFRWQIPPRYNIGADVVDRHAADNGDGLALIHDLGDGVVHVTAHYGFIQTPHVPSILAACREKGLDLVLDATTFYLGRESLLPTGPSRLARWRKLCTDRGSAVDGPGLQGEPGGVDVNPQEPERT